MRSKFQPPARVAEGWEAVGRGDWQEAREAFEAALSAGETPELLEGLGLAAWWLDDAPTVFQARERAYRLYRERRDRRAAARMAAFLAMDYQLLRGEEAVSNGWFQRAYRLLQGLEPTPEHAFLALQEGARAIYVTHDTAAARAAGARAIEIGKVLGSTELEMVGGAVEGIALVSDGQVEAGMGRLDEAVAAAVGGEMEDPLMIGLTTCYMMFACERIRDLDRAAQWCERVKEFCRQAGLRFVLSICRAHYATILMTRGAWAEAEEELEPVVESMLQTHPGIAYEGLLRLAELRRRQGRLEEAEEVFGRVESHAFGQLGRAAVALDRGDPEGAAGRVERFLRQVPEANVTERAAGYELLVRARAATGDLPAAWAAAADLRRVAQRVGTPLLRGAASSAEAVVRTAEGSHDAARRLLEDAVDLYRTAGAPYDEARARAELARALAVLGREEEAAREAKAAASALREMGATLDAERAGAILAESGKQATDGPLTDRETEVLRLVAEGLSNAEIADQLVLSEHTVHRHVANILTKLDVGSRAAAAAQAAREGLI